MNKIEELRTKIDAIKATGSGKVEYSGNSLALVVGLLRDILSNYVFVEYPDVATMIATSSQSGQKAYVPTVGFFEIRQSSSSPDFTNTYPSTWPAPVGLSSLWTRIAITT